MLHFSRFIFLALMISYIAGFGLPEVFGQRGPALTHARVCMLAQGLGGDTGEISFDGVEITVVNQETEPSSSP
jgi:hypothetical protein